MQARHWAIALTFTDKGRSRLGTSSRGTAAVTGMHFTDLLLMPGHGDSYIFHFFRSFVDAVPLHFRLRSHFRWAGDRASSRQYRITMVTMVGARLR